MKTVGVMGSGSKEHSRLAEPLGALIASLGVNLLTGGGRGTMTATSRAFTEYEGVRGICIGVIPCESLERRDRPKEGYPNPYIEAPIYTHLPYSGASGTGDLSRNHINILSSDAIVALPGGDGTASEVELALRYGKPVIAFGSEEGEFDRFNRSVERTFELSEVEVFLRSRLSL